MNVYIKAVTLHAYNTCTMYIRKCKCSVHSLHCWAWNRDLRPAICSSKQTTFVTLYELIQDKFSDQSALVCLHFAPKTMGLNNIHVHCVNVAHLGWDLSLSTTLSSCNEGRSTTTVLPLEIITTTTHSLLSSFSTTKYNRPWKSEGTMW